MLQVAVASSPGNYQFFNVAHWKTGSGLGTRLIQLCSGAWIPPYMQACNSNLYWFTSGFTKPRMQVKCSKLNQSDNRHQMWPKFYSLGGAGVYQRLVWVDKPLVQLNCQDTRSPLKSDGEQHVAKMDKCNGTTKLACTLQSLLRSELFNHWSSHQCLSPTVV